MVALGEDLKKKMSRHGDGDQTLCRVSRHHSAKALPSVRFLALGKEIFTDKFFAEWALPSATLGKAFAEWV